MFNNADTIRAAYDDKLKGFMTYGEFNVSYIHYNISIVTGIVVSNTSVIADGP